MPPARTRPDKPAANTGFRNRIVGLEYHKAGELVPHPKNWRLHPEAQRSALEAAYNKIGVADAVLAYRSERADNALTLVDGHLRRDLAAADQDVPVLILDLTDAEADMLLASHDVLTTMALRDEEALADLLRSTEGEVPRDLMIAIDPDLTGSEIEELMLPAEGDNPKFPIVPQYDEGYDSVIIFSTSETDWNWLEAELKLPRAQDRSRIGTSHVLTVGQFRERWASR